MAEPHFAGDDDLPRTFRRDRDARDAREREAREREAIAAQQGQPHAGSFGPAPHDYGQGQSEPHYGGAGFSGTVTRFEVPFLHLVRFFLKAVLAAIPALILLTLLLFAGGKVLQRVFPDWRIFEIDIRSVGQTTPQPPVAAPPVAPKATAAPKK